MAEIERVAGALVPLVSFYTRYYVTENEELTFSYGQTVVKEECRKQRRPCACATSSCHGFLPGTDA